MFFLAMLVFIFSAMVLPWWGLAAIALGLGYWRPRGILTGLQVGLAAAVVWIGTSYARDVHSVGLISRRMSVVMGLPSPWLLYGVMGIIGFITAFLFYSAGGVFPRRGRKHTFGLGRLGTG